MRQFRFLLVLLVCTSLLAEWGRYLDLTREAKQDGQWVDVPIRDSPPVELQRVVLAMDVKVRPPPVPVESEQSGEKRGVYILRPQDTRWGIAERCGETLDQLAKDNPHLDEHAKRSCVNKSWKYRFNPSRGLFCNQTNLYWKRATLKYNDRVAAHEQLKLWVPWECRNAEPVSTDCSGLDCEYRLLPENEEQDQHDVVPNCDEPGACLLASL